MRARREAPAGAVEEALWRVIRGERSGHDPGVLRAAVRANLGALWMAPSLTVARSSASGFWL